MKQIEIGHKVKILANFYEFTVVEIKGNQFVCEFTDNDGEVNQVTLPEKMLAHKEVDFLDLLT